MSFGESTTQQLCRLCLRNISGCVSIFSEYIDEEMLDLPKIVKNCVGVEVSESDGYSCMICVVCRKMVLRYNAFKTACQESQYRLQLMPKWLSAGPKDPLATSPAKKQKEGRDTGAGGPPENGVSKRPNAKKLDPADPKNALIRPLAMWTVSKGCWRGTTAHREETIISDVLEDGQEEEGTRRKEDEEFDQMLTDLEKQLDSPRTDTSSPGIPEDHNYSSMTLGDEPLQMCSVVMDATAEDEEVVLDGGEEAVVSTEVARTEVVKMEVEKEREEVKDKKIVAVEEKSRTPISAYASPSRITVTGATLGSKWQIMANGRVLPVKTFNNNSRCLVPKLADRLTRPSADGRSTMEECSKQLMLIKSSSIPQNTPGRVAIPMRQKIQKIPQGAWRPTNGRFSLRTEIPQHVKRIIIRRHAGVGKHIPVIRASRHQGPSPTTTTPTYSILKLKNVTR